MRAVCREAERGFTLIEAAVLVTIFLIASAAAIDAFVNVAHASNADPNRSLALSVAQNALVRARASAAYYGQGSYSDTSGGPVLSGGALPSASSLDFALPQGSYNYKVIGSMVPGGADTAHGGVPPQPVNITLDVQTDEKFANGRFLFSVAVSYPVNAAPNAAKRTVSVSETIPEPGYVPGTVLQHQIAEPARM